MNQPFVMTPQVVSDINKIVGAAYEAAVLTDHVGGCFSEIDFDFSDGQAYPCRDCRIQIACAIYRAEKAGLRDARGRFLREGLADPATKRSIRRGDETFNLYAVPPELLDAITAAKQRPMVPPPIPPAAEAIRAIEAIEAADALEVVGRAPPLTRAPAAPAAGAAPSPEAIMAAASPVPLNGAPPDGWPALDRERLAQICLALGYTEQDMRKKRSTTLVTMILKRKPEWGNGEEVVDVPTAPAAEPPPPVPIEPEPLAPIVKVEPAPPLPVATMAPAPVAKVEPREVPIELTAEIHVVPPKVEPIAPPAQHPDVGKKDDAPPPVDIDRVCLRGSGSDVAAWVSMMFGNRMIEAVVELHVAQADKA